MRMLVEPTVGASRRASRTIAMLARMGSGHSTHVQSFARWQSLTHSSHAVSRSVPCGLADSFGSRALVFRVAARVYEAGSTLHGELDRSQRGDAGPTLPSPGRFRLARWCIQRGRPDHVVGAAQGEIIARISSKSVGRVPMPEPKPAFLRVP